jgi:hypothetical protein
MHTILIEKKYTKCYYNNNNNNYASKIICTFNLQLNIDLGFNTENKIYIDIYKKTSECH